MAGKNTTNGTQINYAERRSQALALRIKRCSYSQIGKALGITKQAAHKLVTKELININEKLAEDRDKLITLELLKLDEAEFAIETQISKGEIPAVGMLMKIQQRRAMLLGLDAPTKMDHRIEDVEVTEYELPCNHRDDPEEES